MATNHLSNARENMANRAMSSLLNSVRNSSRPAVAQTDPSTMITQSGIMVYILEALCARLPINRFFEKQNSAFAFIAVGVGLERRYLLQWNETWHVFNLIGGKLDNSRGDSGLLSYAIQRELEEEIGLQSGEDFEIGPCLKIVKMCQYSRREKKLKRYEFGIFAVTLFPHLNEINWPNYAARWLSTHHENVFASAEETLQAREIRPKLPMTKCAT
jgi:8-oxo-dGTP pyrophosphatase MutT (NUDIX family)